jgi:hypothetical protein
MKAIACGILLCTAALLVPTTPASSLEVNQGSVPAQGSISDRVTTALLSRGLTFEELPAKFDLGAVPAAHAKTLRVQQVSWDVVRRLIQIRLGCESAGQCMPALIQARVPEGREASVRAKLTEGVRDSVAHTSHLRRTPILVQAGKPATLLWEREGMRLTTQVMCLRSGRIGDQVAVRIRERKRLLQAQVVGAGMVVVF